MKEVGGYLGLECGQAKPYHANGVSVNSGSGALRLIIRKLGIKNIWLPYYTCPVVNQAVMAEGCTIRRYELDTKFMPRLFSPPLMVLLFTTTTSEFAAAM